MLLNNYLKIALSLSLTVWAIGAHAVVIEYTSDFNVYTYKSAYTYDATASGSQTNTSDVQLQGFDASLGTLTNVQISFSSAWDHTAYLYAHDNTGSYSSSETSCSWGRCYTTYYNYINDTSATATAYSDLSVMLVDPGSASSDLSSILYTDCASSISLPKTSTPYSRTCTDFEKVATDTTFNGTLDLSFIDTQDFVKATGDLVELSFLNSKSVELTCDNNDPGDMCRGESYGNWLGSVTIAYTYDVISSVSVPEPETLALMGIGLLLLGVNARTDRARA